MNREILQMGSLRDRVAIGHWRLHKSVLQPNVRGIVLIEKSHSYRIVIYYIVRALLSISLGRVVSEMCPTRLSYTCVRHACRMYFLGLWHMSACHVHFIVVMSMQHRSYKFGDQVAWRHMIIMIKFNMD